MDNYVFFGSPRFASIVLEKLIANNLAPKILIANPDRPFGRKKILTKPLTKEVVLKLKPEIEVLQPENLRGFDLKKANPLFGVVAAYAKIIPQALINQFPLGVIGVHPSLLPLWRGPAPIQAAILNGDKQTGVSLYKLGAGVDDGPVLIQEKFDLNHNFDYLELESALANLGADLLLKTIPKFKEGLIKPLEQDKQSATSTKKFSTADAFLTETDLERAFSGADHKLALLLDRKIKAFNPEPGAWTLKNGKRMKLIEASVFEGKLKLRKIQYEGKKVVELI